MEDYIFSEEDPKAFEKYYAEHPTERFALMERKRQEELRRKHEVPISTVLRDIVIAAEAAKRRKTAFLIIGAVIMIGFVVAAVLSFV